MILNSYISEQLAVARERDLREAAKHERLAGQARAHNRHRIQPHGLRRDISRSRAVDSCLCASAPRIAPS